MTHWNVWHRTYVHSTPPIHSYVRHDSFQCVIRLIQIYDLKRTFKPMTQAFPCVTWLAHVCDMTHSCVWHDSCCFSNSAVLCATFIWRTWLIQMRDMRHSAIFSWCQLQVLFFPLLLSLRYKIVCVHVMRWKKTSWLTVLWTNGD